MARILTLFLFACASVSAFTPMSTTSPTSSRTARFMFNEDGSKSLETVKEGEDAAPTLPEQEDDQSSIVKDMNTGEIKEVKWVDPAMAANTSGEMGILGYALVGLPAILLLNDAFHFLPTEGPLAFLSGA